MTTLYLHHFLLCNYTLLLRKVVKCNEDSNKTHFISDCWGKNGYAIQQASTGKSLPSLHKGSLDYLLPTALLLLTLFCRSSMPGFSSCFAAVFINSSKRFSLQWLFSLKLQAPSHLLYSDCTITEC